MRKFAKARGGRLDLAYTQLDDTENAGLSWSEFAAPRRQTGASDVRRQSRGMAF